MEFRVLRYFLAVVKEETISAAADTLHVSQPTLSRQLMEMEETLGKKLFLRGHRKITLTEEGMFLRQRAQDIIDLVNKTEAEFRQPDAIISGEIHIGGGETDAMRLIARAVGKLQNRHPHIRYHLFSGNADDVTERLDKGLLDFGVLIEPADMKKYDFLRLTAVDRWGLLMRKDSPLATLDHIRPENLRDIPLLCSRQTRVRHEIASWLQDEYESLNIIATYNLIYNAALMVEEGIGSALCLDKLVNTAHNSCLCFRPLNPKLDAGLNIIWKKNQTETKTKAAGLFLQTLQAMMQGIPSPPIIESAS